MLWKLCGLYVCQSSGDHSVLWNPDLLLNREDNLPCISLCVPLQDSADLCGISSHFIVWPRWSRQKLSLAFLCSPLSVETFEIIIIGLGEKKYAVKTLIFTREGMQYYSNGHHSKEAVQSIGLLCWLQAACVVCCTYLPLRKCKWAREF